MGPVAKRQTLGPLDAQKLAVAGGKPLTCAQRIEAMTVQRKQVMLTDVQCWDAEALFRMYDTEKTGLLSRGSLVDLLREIGLDKKLGDSFSASARLAFDAHSADSHFLAFPEFRQLYYHISDNHPDLVPREPALKITMLGARDLPSTDANGKSDPYCTVMCCRVHPDGKVETKPWSKSQTRVVEKTLTPWWGEDHTDKFGYVEGDSLLFHVWDWDVGDKSELIAKAILPGSEFHCPGGFWSTLPMTCMVSDAPKGLVPQLKLRVVVKDMPVPAPRLNCTIHSAWGLPPTDSSGKTDSICSFMVVGKPFSKSSTKVCQKTLEPVWNEDFDGKYRYQDGDDVLFEVRTGSKGGQPQVLGRLVIPNEKFAVLGGTCKDYWLTDVPRGFYPNADDIKGRYLPRLRVSVWLRDMMPDAEQLEKMKDARIVNAATTRSKKEAPPVPAPEPYDPNGGPT